MLVLVLVFVALPSLAQAKSACASGAVVLDSTTTSIQHFDGCLWYLEDAGHQLSMSDMLALPEQQFTRHHTGVLNFGYTKSAYWVRFELNARAIDTTNSWILELALPLVDDVRLYLVRDGQLVDQRRAGYLDNWGDRDLAVPNPVFRLQLLPETTTTVFLRVTNTNAFRLPITLWQLDSYIEKVSIDEAVRGVLLGAILAILAYNLFVAVSVRERSNIYYVLYLVCASIFIATEQVHGAQLLESRPAILDKSYLHFQIILTWFFGLLMARSLLETRERSPDLDYVILLCLYSVAAAFVLSFFMPYIVAMEWIVIGSILLSMILIVVSYLSWRYYNPAARSYFFAWTLALIGFGIYALTVMGYVPLNTFTTYAPQFGLTAQIILFSFALADRIKQVQGEALAWNQRALANLQRWEQERLEKELAKHSVQAKSQFLANMSHEIRTPLAAIIGYGETLLDPDLSEREKRSSAETVVRSGRHLLELVNDILDHSKIDANKLDVEVVPVWLPDLLDEVRAFFEPRARDKGLGFSINCDFPLPEQVLTDPTRFRQILINVCGNALKFTEKGSIALTFWCDRESETLFARVVDTGIGMKPEQLERLFDPFAQASAAISRQYGGTGLGLSISRRLAELLGGNIRVSSTYGEGSEFEVSIHTGRLDGVRFLRDTSELRQRRRGIPVVVAPALKGRILCAEDNDVNRRLVALLVARTGAELVHVSNGAEALELASRERFDVILMDIQMPVMNGRDATVALREAGVSTPVIALTANVMTEDIADYRMAGFTEHLAKPIDKQRFYEVLARYLEVGENVSKGNHCRYCGNVLIAAEDDGNRALVERMLRCYGVEPLTVASGDQAVRQALANTVHLVLMDRHMPEMDGVAATRLLRQAGFRRPIIAFTTGDRSDDDVMLAAGCDGVIGKPPDQSCLKATLARYLTAGADAGETDEEIAQLVPRFLESLGSRREQLRQAFHARDLAALTRHSHQIKGTAGAMGYPLMTRQAAVLEAQLKEQQPDWSDIGNTLNTLDDMVERALQSAPGQRGSIQGQAIE
ncbi:hybrid sensor histidine kinase/response regulator [Marinobacter sp.]|uniref:hybrid sensor histidine kinase/response regulator n=1 Tax=Marinobacter sp. TaxID=50741 RepID=UPI0019F55BE0|nr:hybrid sensor histidine kinase/response regulator [Marinobacter sp.]MBE0486597.1 response regulator [Marinobacter sp.]